MTVDTNAVRRIAQYVIDDDAIPLTQANEAEVEAVLTQAVPALSASESLTWQTVRQLMVALGGYLVGLGYVDQSTVTAVIGVVLTVGPILWRQITIRKKRKVAV